MNRWLTIGISIALLGFIGWTTYDFFASKFEKKESVQVEKEEETTTKLKDESKIQQKEESIKTGIQVGNEAPDFKLETIDGKTVHLSDYRGKKVMLNFWASWCPPCLEEIPELNKFYENTDIEILAVNLTETESNKKAIKSFIEENEMEFTILMDKQLDVADLYQIQPIPSSFFIDEAGIIQFFIPSALYYEHMMQIYESITETD